MVNLLEQIQQTFKQARQGRLSDYHIKKEYSILVDRGAPIVQVLNTHEKKFLAYYIPMELVIIFDRYIEADICARLMKGYWRKLIRKFT